MKPFEFEIFDRQFNFLYNALIDESEFSYKFDAVSPDKNTLQISKDFKPSALSEEVRAPRGWYIRIMRDDEEYQGVITGFEAGENKNKIEYSQLITLFDCEDLVPTKAVLSSSVEDYIKSRIVANFINYPDTVQNLYGLTGNNIAISGSHYGGFSYCDNDDDYTIISLVDDLIIPAAKQYAITTDITLNFIDKSINVAIGAVSGDAKYIEADLNNVIDPEFTIRKTTDEVNRIDVTDTYLNVSYVYYLHSDGTYDTINTDRITPIKNKKLQFSSYSAAKGVVEAPYTQKRNAIEDVFSGRYNTYGEQLIRQFWERFDTDMDFLEYKNYVNYQYYTYSLSAPDGCAEAPDQIEYPPTLATLSGQDQPESAVSFDYGSGVTFHGRWGSEYVNGGGGYEPGEGEDPVEYVYDWHPAIYHTKKYMNSLNHSYLMGFELLDYPDVYDFGSGYVFLIHARGVLRYGEGYKIGELYTPAKLEWFTDMIDFDMRNITEADIIAEAQTASPTTAAQLAASAFSANKYTNLIEFTVKKDDSMINPMEMKIGQVANIIHDGVSYNSILTGKEIKGGLVKLIFGTIRLELTKILNMKGI